MKPALVLCTLAVPALLLAADFWKVKNPSEWNQKEAKKMLSSSPWARSATVQGPGMGGGAAMPGGGSGRGRGRGGGGGASMDAGDASGMGGGTPGEGEMGGGRGGAGGMGEVSAPSTTVTVRWESALPVREATSRLELPFALPAQLKDKPDQFYVISVNGFPMRALPSRGGEDPQQALSRLRGIATLTCKGKEPIKAQGLRVLPGEKSFGIQYYFPRTAPITIEDNEVVFDSRTGPMKVETKFKLKDMVFDNQLNL
jgi:hypothetical protein